MKVLFHLSVITQMALHSTNLGMVYSFSTIPSTTTIRTTSSCLDLSANGNAASDDKEEDEGEDPLKTLMEIPELRELLQSEKMQECMNLLVTGGQEALMKKVKEDPEVAEMAMMLNQIMNGGELEQS